MKKKLAIISSHPIQYNAPMFALLAQSGVIQPKIFYTWSQSKASLFDKDFGKTIQWDIPLLEGYDHEFVDNVSSDPGPHHRNGIDCPGLHAAIENWGADAILVYGWNYKAHLAVMKYFKGKIPVYFRGDSTLLDETGGVKQILRRLYLKWIYRNTDGAFYVGKNNNAYFLKHGISDNRLKFAPHAIDNKRFADASGLYQKEAKALRSELGIPDQEVIVLFVGKFEPKKNPFLLIKAAQEINDGKLHFVFVGDGKLEEEMKQASQEINNIYFLPFQNQSRMPVIYYLADILALPSQGPGETWGLVVNEAMACGKAILVSTKAGCYSDLVENGINGYVFESGNLEACISQITLMNNKKTCAQMGVKSREMISKWSFAEIVKALEAQMSDEEEK